MKDTKKLLRDDAARGLAARRGRRSPGRDAAAREGRKRPEGFVRLLRPGRAPLGWPILLAGLVALAAFTAALAWWLGERLHGEPAWYFGERRLATWVSTYLLVRAGLEAFSLRRWSRGAEQRFWTHTAAVLVFLGADDLFQIHEYVDWGFHEVTGIDTEHPVTDRIDDVLVFAYGVIAVVAAWRSRATLLEYPWALWTAGVGFACFVAMGVYDWLVWYTIIEETLKLFSAALLLAALAAVRLELEPSGRGVARAR